LLWQREVKEVLNRSTQVFVYDEVEFVTFGKWKAPSVVSCGS
jgi:hypothetical protein